MSDAIRGAFEAWWRGWSNIAPTRQGEGYAEVAENVAWTTWQAALQSQTAPSVLEEEVLVLERASSELCDIASSAEAAGDEDSAQGIWYAVQRLREKAAPQPVPWPKKEDVTEDMRAGFERLYRAKAERDGRTLERNEQGAYKHLPVDADWVFYQRAWADALEATHPAESREEIHGEHCPECGSDKLEWIAGTHYPADVPDGRGRASEARTIFGLGCTECSETVRTIDTDAACEVMNARLRSNGGDA